MTDTNPTADGAAPPRRAARLLRTIGTVLVGAGVATLAGLVATDTWRVGADGGPSLVRADRTTTSSISVPEPAENLVPRVRDIVARQTTRPLSHDDPLRLLVAGDSLAGGFGVTLGDLTTDTGIVRQHVDYRVGTGLEAGDRDWLAQLTDDLAEHDPEVVIFVIGTNDAVIHERFDDATYRADVVAVMDLLTADTDRTVLWVGAPTLRDYDEGARRIDALTRTEAERYENLVYVNSFELTAVDGEYDDTVTGLDGSPTRIRSGDGVHFTNSGNQYVAALLFELVNERWKLRRQADPDAPIGFTTSDDGGDVPGLSQSTSGGSGTTTTYYSTTAPVYTTAPTYTTTPTYSTTVPTTIPTTVPTTTPTTLPTTTTTIATTTTVPTTTTTTAPAPPDEGG